MISPVCIFICVLLMAAKVIFVIKFDNDDPVHKRITNIYWIATDVIVVAILFISYIVRLNK